MKRQKRTVRFLLAAICFLFLFTGCGEIEKAEKTVTGLLEALRKNDMQQAINYVNVYEIQPSSNQMSSEIIMKHLLEKFRYRLVSSEKINSKTVMVKVEFTNINMLPVMELYYNRLAKFYAEFENVKEEEIDNALIQQKIEQIFAECVNQENWEATTKMVDVKVEKEGRYWLVIPDDAFRDALYGGIVTASNEQKAKQ